MADSLNYQSWSGCDNPNLGYGSMLESFKTSAPKTVVFNDNASVHVHMNVPYGVKGWFEGQHRVLFSMWETDVLPEDFRRWLPQYDQVLVPCQHNLELFSEFHDNVSYCPLGVDNKFWKPLGGVHDGPYRFHGGGSLWKRKGLDVLVKAFNALGLPDAELHIKAAPHARDTPSSDLGRNIFLNREWMTPIEQREWFNQADCFVAVSRGEGFGLMPLQAIASGIPTIISDSTGQAQFTDLAFGVVPCGKSKAETTGQWDEPDQKVLEELMVEAYENRDAAKIKAKQGVVGSKAFSWDVSARKFVGLIPTGTLLSNPQHVPPNISVEIHTVRKVNAYIGNATYVLEPDKTYVVPENVYKVLSDSGAIR